MKTGGRAKEALAENRPGRLMKPVKTRKRVVPMEKLLTGLNTIMRAIPADEDLRNHFRQVMDQTEAMVEMIVELKAQVHRLTEKLHECQEYIEEGPLELAD